jgi:hypothetical protein
VSFTSDRRSRHVCIVVQNLPVPFDRRVWLECQALRDHGYEVSVVCPRGNGDAGCQVLDGVHLFKYRAFPPITRQAMFVAEYVYSILATLVNLVRAWKRRPFGIVQVCNPPDVLWAAVLPFTLIFGVKMVFDQHDLCPELYQSRFSRPSSAIHRALLLTGSPTPSPRTSSPLTVRTAGSHSVGAANARPTSRSFVPARTRTGCVAESLIPACAGGTDTCWPTSE